MGQIKCPLPHRQKWMLSPTEGVMPGTGPSYPWHSGRAESQGGREGLRAVKSKVCCSCCWEEGEGSKTSAVAAGKGHLLQAPQLLHQNSSGRDGSPKVWHALSRHQGQESASSKTALPGTTTMIQFNIQTRCMSLPRNTSCLWWFFSPTEPEPALHAGESPSLHLPIPTQGVWNFSWYPMMTSLCFPMAQSIC